MVARVRLPGLGLSLLLLIVGCASSNTSGSLAASSPSASPVAAQSAAVSGCLPAGASPATGANPSPEAEGIAAIEAKTGFRYCPGGCAATASCVSGARVIGVTTSGTNNGAAYVQATIVGSPDFQTCYAYFYFDANAWHGTTPVACPTQAETTPELNGHDHVNVVGGCANMRSGPGLSYPVVVCLSNGTRVLISSDYPQYRGGHIWWHLSQPADGWMAHDFLVGA